MAEELIEKLYAKCMLYENFKQCIDQMYCRSTSAFSYIWNRNCTELLQLINDIEIIDSEKARKLRDASFEVKDAAGNILLCASLIESKLLPALEECVSLDDNVDINLGKVSIVSSKIGFLSLKDNESGIFYNSISDPMWEARKYAVHLYNPSKSVLVIMGVGLGYLPYQLWTISEKSMDIYIYETNSENIRNARKYGVLDWIPEKKMHIFVEESSEKIFEDFINTEVEQEHAIYIISDIGMSQLDKNEFDRATSFMINQKAVSFYESLYTVNYRENNNGIKLLCENDREKIISTIADWNKEAIVIAAGPSLDNCIEFIKESKGKRIIIAVNTVLRRLLKEGIDPDIVTVLDPNEGIMPHIKDIEEATERLILVAESCAYWGYLDSFRGEKYRINSLDCSSEMEEIEKNGKWDVSGTVSNLAIQTAIYFGVDKIYMAGLDLAYPDNKSYAGDLGTGKSENAIGNMTTRAVDGGIVNTSYVFDGFRKAIECKISDNSDIEFINLSKNGAMIKGSISGQWWEEISKLIKSESRMQDIEAYVSKLSEDRSLRWSEKYYLLMLLTQKVRNVESEEDKCVIVKLFDNVFESIVKEVSETEDFISVLVNNDEKVNESTDIVYLLTTGESLDNGPLFERMMYDAERIRHQLKLPVLIIDTNEYWGGEYIATDYRNNLSIDRLNSECERLIYHGEEYPCAVMDYPMPDMEIIELYSNILLNKKPREIIVYDKYSVVCKLFGKYTFIEKKYDVY